MRYFRDIDAWQISATGTKDVLTEDGIRIAPAAWLLRYRLVPATSPGEHLISRRNAR
jgi:hypothetical protein